MKALINAVATSIQAEVTGANQWTVEKTDPIWRNPRKGKVCNIYSGPHRPVGSRWSGSAEVTVDVIIEYAESATDQPAKLKRNETAEHAAEDIADAITTWAFAHEEGFAPAWKMEWAETEYTPQVQRELLIRYCRVTVRFFLTKSFT